MFTKSLVVLVTVTATLLASPPDAIVQLRPADITNPKGNKADDAWQFWFEIIHAKGTFERLSLHTKTMPAQQRKDGIKKKVRGPIASMLPNPGDTEGWIYHRDWDGRFEGIWTDAKTGAILVHPYQEKKDAGALAITYRIPAAGRYLVTGGLTDLQVAKDKPHDGARWRLEKPVAKGKWEVVGRGGPFGDAVGPESVQFAVKDVALKEGDLLRLIIDPIDWWGTDLIRIDSFKIERAQ